MSEVRYLPPALQTMYADLVDRSEAALFVDTFSPSGIFKRKTIKGRNYWYYQDSKKDTSTGTQKQKYVGPETEAILKLIGNHGVQKSSFLERREIVNTLIQCGVSAPLGLFGEILDALARAGVFRLRASLVGTFAFQTYEGLLGVSFPKKYSQSLDLDIAQFREISIAIAETEQTGPFLEILKKVDPSFEGVPSLDRRSPATSFVNKRGFRVDVLIPNRGPEQSRPAALHALGVHGQFLRYLDYLIYRPVKAVVLHGGGVLVTVPQPAKFATHKLIVSQVRNDIAKRRKDLWQAESLFKVLMNNDKFSLVDAFSEAVLRGPKWRKNVLRGLKSIDEGVASALTALLRENGVVLETGGPPQTP